MPFLGENQKVIAGYNQGLGEDIIVCNNLQEMQELHQYYLRGGAVSFTWYIGKDPGYIFFE